MRRQPAYQAGSIDRTALRGAWVRHWMWRMVLAVSGRVTVVGQLPPGGCVVVANHTSHADTPSLLAALDPGHAPRVAAAADYWFTRRSRRAVCVRLAAGFPVRRAGGGSSDLAAMRPALLAGHAVVIYPEGTRGDGAEVAEFRGGALRLAAEAGVPVVPVGIAGTAHLMPKNGKPQPASVRIHIGSALHDPTPGQARDAVAELAMDAYAERTNGRDNGLRTRIARLAAKPRMLLLATAWAFAEALSWPLMPEVLLAIVCVAAPTRGFRLVPAITAGTVAGGLLALNLAAVGAAPPAPWTTDRMRSTARAQLADEGASAASHQPWNGIPYKIYAAEAGRTQRADVQHIGAAEWAWETAKARTVRHWAVAAVFTGLGVAMLRVRRLYGLYVAALTVCFSLGLWLIVHNWQ